MSDAIVKNLNFGKEDAKNNVFKGIDKLTQAVSSTLGASGKCVILEDEHRSASNNKRRCNSCKLYYTVETQ